MEKDEVGPDLQRWLERVTPRVASLLRRRSNLPGDAVDDLVQESVARWLCRSGSRLVPAAMQPEAVLQAIARRVWLESLAAAQRRSRLLREWSSLMGLVSGSNGERVIPAAGIQDPGVTAEAGELRAEVQHLLRRFLAPRQIEVFVLVWLEAYSWREAADRCGLTAAHGEAARRRFRRLLSAEEGRRSLRVLLDRFGIEPPNPRTLQLPMPEPPTRATESRGAEPILP